ncbi:MAG: DUF222 domain-containing protein [Candidatus Dormiibacterota bacterium]
MSKTITEDVGRRIEELSAQINAATAELVQLSADYDDVGGWLGAGLRSCAHWLSIHTGVDVHTGAEMVRTGHALETLPRIAEAFHDGRLSFDKVRKVTRVAVPEDEKVWLEVALNASGGQLTRICRAVSSALDAADQNLAQRALERRSVRKWWRDDGMLQVMAVLPREDGAVVVAAIEAAAAAIAAEARSASRASGGADDPAERTHEMLRADAFVRVCEEWVASVSTRPTPAPTRQVVVHVDQMALRERDPAARCHIEDGPWLPFGAARWLSCDSDVVSVLERDGESVDVSRVHRVVSAPMRLALQARDRGCRFPGCSVPPARTEGHHIKHWAQRGRTTMPNLVSLCRFHHRRHHEGAFEIRVVPGEPLRFELSDGTVLQPVVALPSDGLPGNPAIRGDAAVALDGGASFDREHAVNVIAEACWVNRAHKGDLDRGGG